MGRHFDEKTLLRVAHRFQGATDFHTSRPNL
jgi:Asp-tRNA(Asn)/Glu-tRNA(Gln) amidotransferase A subunit family amidase